jgi:hypothetical protein
VGTGRVLVHICCAGDSVLLAVGDNSEELVFIADIVFSEVLDEAALLVLPDLEVVLADVQQIPDLLHVELEDRNFEFELDGVGRFFDGCE